MALQPLRPVESGVQLVAEWTNLDGDARSAVAGPVSAAQFGRMLDAVGAVWQGREKHRIY